MKQFGKWIGSSALMLASVFMLTSLLSCGGNTNKPGQGGEKFEVKFGVEPAGKGKIVAKVDGKDIKSGDKVEKNKEVVFTLSVTDEKKYEYSKWEGEGLTNTTATGAKLKVTKKADIKAVLKDKSNGGGGGGDVTEGKTVTFKVVDDKGADVPATKASISATKKAKDATSATNLTSGDKVAKDTELVFTLKIDDATYMLDKWEGATQDSANKLVAKTTMDASDINVVAKIKPNTTTGDGHTVTFKVVDEKGADVEATKASISATKKAKDATSATALTSGEKVAKDTELVFTLKIDDTTYMLDKWEGATQDSANKLVAKATMDASDINVVAKLKQGTKKHKVTFLTDPADKGTFSAKLKDDNTPVVSGTTEVIVGKVVEVTLTITDNMKKLDKWECDDVSITGVQNLTASFTMPDKDIEMKAKLIGKDEKPSLVVSELKYKDGAALVEPYVIHVEESVEEVQATDFKVKFAGHESENITFDSNIAYEPGPKLVEGENTITLKVPAKANSYAETTVNVKVIKIATLRLESLKVHGTSVNMPSNADWTVEVEYDHVKVEPSNVEAMFTWAGQTEAKKLDVTVTPATHTLSQTATELTLAVVATNVYKAWTHVVKVTRGTEPGLEYDGLKYKGKEISATKQITVENSVTTIPASDFVGIFNYGEGEKRKLHEEIQISSIELPASQTELQEGENIVTLKVDAKPGHYLAGSITGVKVIREQMTGDPELELEKLECTYPTKVDITATKKLTVGNNTKTFETYDFEATFKTHGKIDIDEISYGENKTELAEGENTITLKVNAKTGKYKSFKVDVVVTREAAPTGKTITFKLEPAGKGRINVSYRDSKDIKIDVVSGKTKVPAGSKVIFNVVNNVPAKYTFGTGNWTHTGVPTGAWKTEAASPTRAELTMPDADVTVTATLQEKLPPAKIATLKIKSATNSEVLFEADAELLKNALNTYTPPADIVLPFGTENCKFEVVTNPQGANVAYTPNDLGTTGHKFTSTATNVDLVVGTDGVHTKSTYKFNVKVADKPETKLKSITINGTKLTDDEMKLADENDLIKLVSSPCKINWEADTGIEVSADNGVQKDTTFEVTTTEWKKVVITIKNTLKNNETKTYTVKLRKAIGDGKPELKDISVSGVAITLADLEKALEESTAPVIEIEKPTDGSGASVSISWTDEDDDNFKVKAAKKLGNGVYGGNKDVSEDGSYEVEMPKPDEATKLPVTVKITITFGGKSRMYYVKLKYKA